MAGARATDAVTGGAKGVKTTNSKQWTHLAQTLLRKERCVTGAAAQCSAMQC